MKWYDKLRCQSKNTTFNLKKKGGDDEISDSYATEKFCALIYNNNHRPSYTVYACVHRRASARHRVERDGRRASAGHRVERFGRPTCACVTSHLFTSPVPTRVDAFGCNLRIDGAEVAILKRNVSF